MMVRDLVLLAAVCVVVILVPLQAVHLIRQTSLLFSTASIDYNTRV